MHINSKAEFEELVNTIEVPLLIFLTNRWSICSDKFKKSVEDFKNNINILEINVDNCPELLPDLGLRNVPATLVYVNGKKQVAIEGTSIFVVQDLVEMYGTEQHRTPRVTATVNTGVSYRPVTWTTTISEAFNVNQEVRSIS